MTRLSGVTGMVILIAFVTVNVMAAGDGINVNGIVIKPSASVKGTFDSNVQVSDDNEQDDVSVIGRISLGVQKKEGNVKLDGNVYGLIERYSDLDEEDHEDFGEKLGVTLFDRDQLKISLSESYDSLNDLDYSTGTIEQRELLNAAVSLGKDLTDKLGVDVGYKYYQTEYEADYLFDWNDNAVDLKLSHALTDKTAGVLYGIAGKQDSDGNTEDGDYVAVRVGLESRRTDKIRGRAGVGLINHESDEDISIVSFQVGADWQATEKVVLNVNAGNGIEPAPQNAENYKISTRATVGAKWQVAEALSASASVSYMNNDYDRDVDVNGTLTEKEDDIYTGRVRVTYAPPADFMELYAEGKVEDKDSSVESNDYAQTQVSVGVKLSY